MKSSQNVTPVSSPKKKKNEANISQISQEYSTNFAEKQFQNHTFKIQKETLLGAGAYSSVYLGLNTTLNNMKVAIKIEKNPQKYLEYEAKILKFLQGGIGIPQLYDYFNNDQYSFLIIEHLGQDLRTFFKNQPVILESTLVNISIQMLTRVEFLHSKGLIHRDIKPENYCLGSAKSNTRVYLIDYGLCKPYIHKNKKHIEFQENQAMAGTSKYTSINSHLNVSVSRKDDLESLAYSIISLFRKGKLPWDKVKYTTYAERNNLIMEMKIQMSEEELCKGLHPNLVTFLKYTKNLKFEETPNYKLLYDLLKGIYIK